MLGRIYRSSVSRYLAVGLFSFAVDFFLLFLVHEVFGAPVWLAAAVAFLASFIVNFLLQKVVSFRSQGNHRRSLVRYSALVAINTVATSAIVSAFDQFDGNWEVGKVVSTALMTVWNFFIYRYWVFAHDDATIARVPPTRIDHEQDGKGRV